MIWDSSVWTPCGFNCRYILRTLTNIFTQEHLFSPINRLDTLDSHSLTLYNHVERRKTPDVRKTEEEQDMEWHV